MAGAILSALILVIALHTANYLRTVRPALELALLRSDSLMAKDRRHGEEQIGLLLAVENTRSIVDSLKAEVRDVRWQVEQLHKVVRGDK